MVFGYLRLNWQQLLLHAQKTQEEGAPARREPNVHHQDEHGHDVEHAPSCQTEASTEE